MKHFRNLALLAVAIVASFFAGCATDSLNMGPNGDARIREISFKDMTLIPSFDPYVTSYTVVRPDMNAPVYGKVVPFIYYTKVLLNGEAVRMATNGYKLPVFTDLTRQIKNNELVITTTAQDGMQRSYTVKFLDGTHDAGLAAIGTTGVMYPQFSEGIAPAYEVAAFNGQNNVYEIVSGTTTVPLRIVKRYVNSVTRISNLTIGAGTISNQLTLTLPSTGDTVTFKLTNISASNDFTNVKTIVARYVNPASDNSLLGIQYYNAATGKEIRSLPVFYHGSTSYGLTLDDVRKINIKVTKSQAGATVVVTKTSIGTNGQAQTPVSLGSNTADKEFTISGVDVDMADKLSFTVTLGAAKTYTTDITMFTRETYGFDGGISKLMRILKEQQAIPETSTNFMYPVEGVITMFTHVAFNPGERAGFYLEDGGYGLYVWTYDGWQIFDSTGTATTDKLMVGQRIKIYVKAIKYWIGMPEVTRLWNRTTSGVNPRNPFSKLYTEIITKKPRAIFYQDGYEQDYGQERQLARLFRYKTPVGSPITAYFDESGIGNFNPQKAFKLFLPYPSGTFANSKLDAKKYMLEGVYGSFYGPSFTDGDGPSLIMKGKEYMILE